MLSRKNVKNLSNGEKEQFVNAVLKLKKSKSLIHPDDFKFSRYDDYVEMHMHAMMVQSTTDPLEDPEWYPGWAHNGPAFLPWHREYLLQFEKDLQSVSEDDTVFIPYWDWSDNESFPFTSDFLGTDGEQSDEGDPGKVIDGPFAFDGPNHWTIVVKDEETDPDFLTRGFGRRGDALRLPTSVQIHRIMQIPFYDSPVWKLGSPGFRTGVEVPLHNLVHRWVNGTMITMCSPNDPVFWLHHANIDRLWGDWQRIHPTTCPYLPSKGAPEGHNLYDILLFSDHTHHSQNSHSPHHRFKKARIINVLNHLLLDYTYDSDPKEIVESFTKEIKVRPKISRDKHKLSVFPSLQEIT
jgi:tyrosinase